jgi:hypothetical protein
LPKAGATASVDSITDSYESNLTNYRSVNATAEAPNGSFKAELIEHQGPWRGADQVERAVVPWVGWYDTERLHSALDYFPPEEFEAPLLPIPGDHERCLKPTNQPLRNSEQLIPGRSDLLIERRG